VWPRRLEGQLGAIADATGFLATDHFHPQLAEAGPAGTRVAAAPAIRSAIP
jgi:hypothetical protein